MRSVTELAGILARWAHGDPTALGQWVEALVEVRAAEGTVGGFGYAYTGRVADAVHVAGLSADEILALIDQTRPALRARLGPVDPAVTVMAHLDPAELAAFGREAQRTMILARLAGSADGEPIPSPILVGAAEACLDAVGELSERYYFDTDLDAPPVKRFLLGLRGQFSSLAERSVAAVDRVTVWLMAGGTSSHELHRPSPEARERAILEDQARGAAEIAELRAEVAELRVDLALCRRRVLDLLEARAVRPGLRSTSVALVRVVAEEL